MEQQVTEPFQLWFLDFREQQTLRLGTYIAVQLDKTPTYCAGDTTMRVKLETEQSPTDTHPFWWQEFLMPNMFHSVVVFHAHCLLVSRLSAGASMDPVK
jgi:hypothetical protein